MAVSTIDPSKAAKYPIHVADQLLRNSQRTRRHNASVQLNHKPKLSQSTTTTTIKPLSDQDRYELSIGIDGDTSKYAYTGSQRSTCELVLIYDPNKDILSLDKLDTEFTFNLHSTPSNSNSRSLEEQYPHIGNDSVAKDSSAEADLFGEDAESEVGDPNNPYDYRHFLHAAKRPRTASPEPRSTLASPAPYPSIEASPLQRPAQTSNKPKPRPRPQQKRPVSPPPREEVDADNEESDDGGLIIEMEPETNKRRNRFMGAFDRDAGSTGPISLRSAASSMSPAARVIRRPPSEESDKSGIDILEDLKLPSPQRAPPPRTPQQEAEEEADLEAELEMALEGSQADEGDEEGAAVNGLGITVEPSQVVHEESSEESEEE